jgi:hypothetical protein
LLIFSGRHLAGDHTGENKEATMDINELTMGQAKELAGAFGAKTEALPFRVGMKVFARTVTYHVTGEITEVNGKWLTLKTAAWIADSGRFADALRSCNFEEVEPFAGAVYLNTDSITDATEIDTLPEGQK